MQVNKVPRRNVRGHLFISESSTLDQRKNNSVVFKIAVRLGKSTLLCDKYFERSTLNNLTVVVRNVITFNKFSVASVFEDSTW